MHPKRKSHRSAPDGRSRWLLLASAALYAALVLVYAPSVAFPPLSLDDQSQLEAMADAPWARVLGPDQFGHVRPAKSALFLLLARAGGDSRGFRLALLGLFLLSVALVQRFAARLASSAALGLAAAACWACNPTVAGVVCWLSAANIALSAAAVLAYVACGARLLDRSAPPVRPRALLAAALLALLVGLASYELALLAPLALLLYRHVGPHGAPLSDAGAAAAAKPWTRSLWLGSAACAASYLVLHAVARDGPLAYRSAATPGWLLAASAPRYFVENARLWLWPWGSFGVLFVDAPAEHAGANLSCWVLLLAAAALGWRFRRRDPAIVFGLGWFGLFLLPLCNLVPLGNTPIAVHYLYLPAIGLAIALCRTASLVLARAPAPSDSRRRSVAAGLVIVICLAFVAETRSVVAAFGDEERLYALSNANHPDNVEVLVNLGRVYIDRGKHELARHALDRAARLAPADLGVLRNRYALLVQQGQPAAALALTETPSVRNLPEFLIRRGEALVLLGRHAEAGAAFGRAFERTSDRRQRLMAGYQLVIALLRTEQIPRAEALVEQLLREFPDQPELLQARQLLRAARGEPN